MCVPVVQVLNIGAIGCPMYQLKGPKMAKRDYAPNFPLKHAQKDMRLALEMGAELGLPLPTTAAANEEFVKALDEHGDEDFSAVYEQSTKKA
jgi:glyoxylate/succinic semialdehyde reductase